MRKSSSSSTGWRSRCSRTATFRSMSPLCPLGTIPRRRHRQSEQGRRRSAIRSSPTPQRAGLECAVRRRRLKLDAPRGRARAPRGLAARRGRRSSRAPASRRTSGCSRSARPAATKARGFESRQLVEQMSFYIRLVRGRAAGVPFQRGSRGGDRLHGRAAHRHARGGCFATVERFPTLAQHRH